MGFLTVIPTTVPATTAAEGSSLLPAAQNVLGWIDVLARLAVLVGPVLILGFGLLFLLTPPKEANHSAGYRFWWGMASLEAWKFTQRLAGIVWFVLGLVLLVVMSILCIGFGQLEQMVALGNSMICILWQIGALVVACIAIDIAVVCVFDRKGFRRRRKEE